MTEPLKKRARRQLASHDPLDLAAGIGGLQLIPDNADRLARLQVAAELVGQLNPTGGRRLRPKLWRRRMGPRGWRRWLNDSSMAQVASQEDPFNDLFVEEIMFIGGPYLVFSGIASETTFVIKNILRAIFLAGYEFPNQSFVSSVAGLTRATLLLSDEIAKRVNLQRGDEAPERPGRPVVLPTAKRLRTLKEAVSFSGPQLIDLLDGLPNGILDPLIRIPGPGEFEGDSPWSGPVVRRPILDYGERYVVAMPSSLLTALRHAILCLAVEHSVESELAHRGLRQTFRPELSREIHSG